MPKNSVRLCIAQPYIGSRANAPFPLSPFYGVKLQKYQDTTLLPIKGLYYINRSGFSGRNDPKPG